MNESRTRVFVTMFGLVAAGLMSVGCTGGADRRPSSSTGGAGSTTNIQVAGTTGSAGTTDSAGTTGNAGTTDTTGSAGATGDAGATGSAGAVGSAGTTGDAGATGSAGATASVPACAAPSSAVITDFGSKSTVGTPYKGADVGLAVPMVSTSSGALVIKLDTGPPSTDYPYAYVGLPFNACTGAAAYTGVKFNIGGTLSTGCRVVFSAVDAAHTAVANHGTCKAANCYPSQAGIELPETPMDVTVMFLDQSGGGADPEVVDRIDPNHLLGLQWQFNPATGDAGGCTGTVTIDNVSFM